ncbi:MAG: electron transfer flavoprotein subunit beta/FixA family protein [SAR202 cluster bacterium]|jgi:electron transfer flavoprotein beta subunit|nr:electron transfer flavoprotein subunit beta/FixA family protein [SAR202 cluster bacterium]
MNIVVCVKQVVDPDVPTSAFRLDDETNRVRVAEGIPPVINGFDENAVEAALIVREETGGKITALSVGNDFAMDVMKKPLSMGVDDLVLIDDPQFFQLDAYATVCVLSEAIRKIGEFDLILCGRQASDWDNAHVPLGLAETLGLPSITMAQQIEISNSMVLVHRVFPDGYEKVEADLPALVTVSNEIGQPRYPTLRGIMAASRKSPIVWTARDLGIDPARFEPKISVTGLSIPPSLGECEFIEADTEAEAGSRLAQRLREVKLI